MTYREQFPDFPPDTMPPIPDGWTDISWRNDACPSFLINPSLAVYIDFADPERSEFPEWRESGDLMRFSLHPMDDGQHISGGSVEPGQPAPFQTDSWDELLAEIERRKGN